MSTGDESQAPPAAIRRMQLQLSILTDYALVPTNAYDDMYLGDNWKCTTFRRYRQAVGLSPLGFLRQHNQLLELQQLHARGEMQLRAKKRLEACSRAIQNQLLTAGEYQLQFGSKKSFLLEKCETALKWLECTPEMLQPAEDYASQQADLEKAYFDVFKKHLSSG